MSRALYLVTDAPRRPQVTGVANLRARQPRTATHVHPALYDWAQDTTTTAVVPLSPMEWSLIHQALVERGSGNSLRPGGQVWLDLAGKVRESVRGQVVHAADDTPAHGLPRPS